MGEDVNIMKELLLINGYLQENVKRMRENNNNAQMKISGPSLEDGQKVQSYNEYAGETKCSETNSILSLIGNIRSSMYAMSDQIDRNIGITSML